MPRRILYGEELGSCVDGEDTVEFGGGDVVQLAKVLNSGVADQNVQSTKIFGGLFGQQPDLVRIADVRLYRDHAAAAER